MPTTIGLCCLDDFDGVADVIAVTVSAEQDVGLLDFLVGLGTLGIAHDPGIDDDGLARRRFDAEGRVAEPGELDAFQIHDAPSIPVQALLNIRSSTCIADAPSQLDFPCNANIT